MVTKWSTVLDCANYDKLDQCCYIMAYNMMVIYEPQHEISNNGMCDQQRLRPACADVQSDQSLCQSLEYFLNIMLLTEHHLEILSLTGGCTCSSESTLVKMPHGWKSHVGAQLLICLNMSDA